MPKQVKVGGHPVDGKPFTFIGGPCVIETRDVTLAAAEKLAAITLRLHIPFIFKSSYDKANRTSIEGYRGPGIEEGLKILKEVKDYFGVPVLTDVHSPREAALAADVVDVSRCRRSSPGRPTCSRRAEKRAGWSISRKASSSRPKI